MSNYLYEAVDASGVRSQGALDVIDQSEALKRIREMGLFPTTIRQAMSARFQSRSAPARKEFQVPRWLVEGRIKPATLAVFTRQLATLVDVGMPLLRGLRLLQEQEENRALKRVITEVAKTVESGGTLSEALAAHPKVFSRLYVNMVKAGETGGILELVLRRQAEFMEKALKIKGKIKAAMFYPMAVLGVAAGILTLLLVFVIPRFQTVFEGLLNGKKMPAFTLAVLKIADNCDEEVDNAVTAMTSLLEPIMIIFLAIIVGSIVIAMFLPLIDIMNDPTFGGGNGN
jgi:type IV pilus assembly protein PilC